jgi:drug/metabolite transporter (DMT)-like permease
MVNSKNFKVAALFSVVVLVFGLNYIFVNLGLAYSPPIWLAFFRALLGFVGVAVLLYALQSKSHLTLKQKGIAMLLGVPGAALFFGLWFLAGTKVLPGLTSVIIYTYPLWIVILSVLLLKEPIKPRKIGAVLLGFFGVALAAQIGFESFTVDTLALAELAVAAFCFAFLNVMSKRFFKGETLLQVNMWQLAGALLPLLVWALFSSPFNAVQWNWEFVGVLLWLGILGTAVNFCIWFWMLAHYNASSLGGYSFLSVAIALVSSILIFGETVSPIQAVGVAVILSAVYLVSKT